MWHDRCSPHNFVGPTANFSLSFLPPKQYSSELWEMVSWRVVGIRLKLHRVKLRRLQHFCVVWEVAETMLECVQCENRWRMHVSMCVIVNSQCTRNWGGEREVRREFPSPATKMSQNWISNGIKSQFGIYMDVLALRSYSTPETFLRLPAQGPRGIWKQYTGSIQSSILFSETFLLPLSPQVNREGQLSPCFIQTDWRSYMSLAVHDFPRFRDLARRKWRQWSCCRRNWKQQGWR